MTENENAPPLPPGTRIHELIIKEPLGRGGAGIVYAARHEILDQVLAVKEFLPGALARRVKDFRVEPLPGQEQVFTGLKQKFLQEGKTLVGLALPRAHPTIVQATDAFRANDTVYLCMCFERGESLDAAVKAQGPLAEAEVRALLVPLLDGLAQVHRHRVLHRDIKPSNILIRDDGSPVLIDFGAAHQERPDGPVSVVAQYTPDFAAPEQIVGGEQGPWTDIYCLAATCVYALTGQTPTGIHIALEPTGSLAGVDPSLLAALNVALNFDWKKRPQNVAEWCDMLSRAGLELESIRSGSGSRSGPKTAWTGVRSDPQQRTQASIASSPATSLTGVNADATQVSSAKQSADLGPAPESVTDLSPVAQAAGSIAEVKDDAVVPDQNRAASPRPARVLTRVLVGLSLVALVGGAGALWWSLTQESAPPPVEASRPDQASTEPAVDQPDAGEPPDIGSTAATKLDQATAEPVQTEVTLIARVKALMSPLDCARLTDVRLTRIGGERVLLLQGFVRDQQQLARLNQSWISRLPRVRIDTRNMAIATPFCDTIARLNAVVRGVSIHPGLPAIVFNHADRIYHQDEFLALTATQLGGTAGFLYLDFIDSNGDVASLLPNAAIQSNFLPPGAQLEVGARDQMACDSAPEACFLASQPHGNNLILAIWSARPLEPDWHQATQATDALSELAARLVEQGRVDGGAVTLGYQFVTTAP